MKFIISFFTSVGVAIASFFGLHSQTFINPASSNVNLTSSLTSSSSVQIPITVRDIPNIQPLQNGTIHGISSINQTIDKACPSPASNSTFGIKIYQNDNVVQKLKFNTDGTFNVSLPAGSYSAYPDYYPDQVSSMLVVSPDWMKISPKQFTVQAGENLNMQVTGTFTCNSL